MRAIRAIISKEFAEILRNRTLVISSLIPALIFTVMPLMVGIRGANRSGRSGQLTLSQMGEVINRTSPELRNVPAAALGQIFILRQFAILMLFVPIITALAIAAHSIIGEKQARSLEPLLATPISTAQLLLAKSLSAVLPAVGVTWVGFTIYALAIHFMALSGVLTSVLNVTTLLLMLVICPLV